MWSLIPEELRKMREIKRTFYDAGNLIETREDVGDFKE
jgi:hypothetical protein